MHAPALCLLVVPCNCRSLQAACAQAVTRWHALQGRAGGGAYAGPRCHSSQACVLVRLRGATYRRAAVVQLEVRQPDRCAALRCWAGSISVEPRPACRRRECLAYWAKPNAPPAGPRLEAPLPPPRSASDLELPFECPLDYMLSVANLDASGVAYRTPGFLGLPQVCRAKGGCFKKNSSAQNSRLLCACRAVSAYIPSATACPYHAHPQLPPAVRQGVHPVVIATERPALGALPPLGHAATAWPGIKQGDLLAAVAPYSHAPVLHLR